MKYQIEIENQEKCPFFINGSHRMFIGEDICIYPAIFNEDRKSQECFGLGCKGCPFQPFKRNLAKHVR